jgi:hypothetical protein
MAQWSKLSIREIANLNPAPIILKIFIVLPTHCVKTDHIRPISRSATIFLFDAIKVRRRKNAKCFMDLLDVSTYPHTQGFAGW